MNKIAGFRGHVASLRAGLLLLTMLVLPLQAQESAYRISENWVRLPADFIWGQIAAVDLDAEGNLYVFQRCGSNTCVGRSEAPLLKFSPDGELLWSWGSGMIVWPHGLDVDKQGNIWLTDGRAHEGMGQQVLKLSPGGEVLLRIGTAGVSGEGQYSFNGVADVVVADNGDIFVADGHVNNRIVKYAADGTYISEWGRKGTAVGEFNMPHAIAMDSRGRVIVADRDNYRLQVFTQDGTFLHEWRQYGRASGLEVDANDRLYTASQNTNLNPTMVRGLYIGSAADGSIREIIPGFNSEAVAGASDGTIYSGQRPMAGTPAASDPDILQRFVGVDPVDGAGLELTPVQLAANFYMVDESAGSGGAMSFLTGPEGILMVDSGIASLAPRLEVAIRSVSTQPFRYLLNTHMHIDVTEGNEHFARLGATVIAREEVRRGLAHPVAVGNGPLRPAVPALTMPSLTYRDPISLHFNGQEIRLIPLPAAHTDGDALVHFPAIDIIVAGDILRPGSYPSINRYHGGTLQGMLDALALLIDSAGSQTRIFTSHGEVVGREAALTQRDDILRVRDRIAALIGEGRGEQEIMAMYEALTADMHLDPRWEHTTGSRFVQDIYLELRRAAL